MKSCLAVCRVEEAAQVEDEFVPRRVGIEGSEVFDGDDAPAGDFDPPDVLQHRRRNGDVAREGGQVQGLAALFSVGGVKG